MIEVIAGIVRYVLPVGLAATGETIGQKSGVINIGLEGMMLGSAFIATLVDLTTHSPYLGLLAGIGLALIIGVLQAWFTLKLGSDMVVVGTAINLLALGATGTLYRVAFGGGGKLLSVASLPRLGPFDPIMILSLGLVGSATWALVRTNWGLVTRAAGEYPSAVRAAGFSVMQVRLLAVLVASAFAGLAGAYLSIGVAASFAENLTSGRGFLALAMVTFGRWKPWQVVGGSLLVGLFDWGQFALQAASVPVPSQLLRAMPYVLALLILVFSGKRVRPPSALGQSFAEEESVIASKA